MQEQCQINYNLTAAKRNERIIIDALNSIGYCIRYRATAAARDAIAAKKKAKAKETVRKFPRDADLEAALKAELKGAEAKKNSDEPKYPPVWDIGDEALTQDVLARLLEVYETALSYDTYDIEANFNLANVYM